MPGIIMGALGGMGEQAANVGSTLLKSELDREARVQASDLETMRQKTLKEFEQSQKDAPLNRMQGIIGRVAAEEVPQEAKRVTELPGYDPAKDASGPAKFRGDVAEIVQSVQALPDGPDKTAAMAQLKAQYGEQVAQAEAAVSGKTRKRTDAEIRSAATSIARQEDLPALAAYETAIGKSEREDRRIDVTEAAADARLKATEATTAQREREAARRDETNRYIADQRDRTAQQRIEALVERLGSKGENGALQWLDGSRKMLAEEAQRLQQHYATSVNGATPTRKAALDAEYKPKFEAIEKKRALIDADFDALRERIGLPARTATPAAQPPGPAAAPKPAASATSALPLPKVKDQLVSGKVYQTSRGPAKWNGTAFEAQ